MSYLEPSALATLGSLPVKARIIVDGALTGLHRSRHRGSSVEFAEHKEYAPGDEIRHIDWKAYAKLDRYYVKQFEQESQLTAQLLLDSSASMAYAGKDRLSKLAYGAHMIAALAYLLIRQRDKAGLSIFGDPAVDAYLPPRARPAHLSDIFTVLDDVVKRGGQGGEPAAAALERIAELSRRRRSLIILISDLLGDEDAVTVLKRLRAQRHDVVLFHLLDPDELTFPFRGLTLFDSLEDDRKLLVSAEAARREYLRRLDAFLQAVKQGCIDSGVEYHLAPTDQPFEHTLLQFLSLRARTSAVQRSSTWSF